MANTMKAGLPLMFKTGTQEKMDDLLKLNSSANASSRGGIAGCIYLTSDTHRLYVGNEDNSISALNQGIITVSSMSVLNTIAGKEGQFYYIPTGNILCVYSKNHWVQINDASGSGISEFGGAVSDVNNTATFTTTIEFSNDPVSNEPIPSKTSTVKITGEGGLKVASSNNDTITLTAPVYKLSAEQTEAQKDKSVTLTTAREITSGNTVTKVDSTTVTLSAGNNIQLNESDGTVTIAATKVPTGVVIENKNSKATTNPGTGYVVGLKDINGALENSIVTFDPVISVGTTNYHFDDNKIALDVYSKAEIDSQMQSLNAMTYRGSIGGTYSTFAELICKTGDTIVGFRKKESPTDTSTTPNIPSATNPLHIGDTFVLSTSCEYNGITYEPGSLVIVNSASTETTGEITSWDKVSLTFIQESANTDTTYSFQAATGTNEVGIELKPDTSSDISGSLTFNGDAYISVAKNDTLSADAKYVIDITHNTTEKTIINPVANETDSADATHSAWVKNSFDANSKIAKMEVTAIEGISLDDAGHVTGVTTTKHVFKDGTLTGNTYAVTTPNNNTVYSIDSTVVSSATLDTTKHYIKTKDDNNKDIYTLATAYVAGTTYYVCNYNDVTLTNTVAYTSNGTEFATEQSAVIDLISSNKTVQLKANTNTNQIDINLVWGQF